MLSDNLPMDFQHCGTNFICDEYTKVREYVFTQVIIWVNTISNHNVIMAILLEYEGTCMIYG